VAYPTCETGIFCNTGQDAPFPLVADEELHNNSRSELVFRSRLSALIIPAMVVACGGAENPPNEPAGSVAEAVTRSMNDLNAQPNAADDGTLRGGLEFTADGESKSFGHIPKGNSYYTNMASQVNFYPASGSTEYLSLTIMGADLKALEYPVELPLPRDGSVPVTMANRGATIGLSYIDAEGTEWSAPATVRFESFSRDGVLTGSFENQSIRNVGKQLPDITLDAGSFSAQVTAPW
jgi:hypothetical protein